MRRAVVAVALAVAVGRGCGGGSGPEFGAECYCLDTEAWLNAYGSECEGSQWRMVELPCDEIGDLDVRICGNLVSYYQCEDDTIGPEYCISGSYDWDPPSQCLDVLTRTPELCHPRPWREYRQ